MIEPEAKPAAEPPPTAASELPPGRAVPRTFEELGALVQELSDAAHALLRLALAETALSALALKRLVAMRLLLMFAVVMALLFLGAAGVIALANWLGSTAAACAIVGVLFLLLAAFAASRAKAWRGRIGYTETRAVLRDGFGGGPDDAT